MRQSLSGKLLITCNRASVATHCGGSAEDVRANLGRCKASVRDPSADARNGGLSAEPRMAPIATARRIPYTERNEIAVLDRLVAGCRRDARHTWHHRDR